ncbi:MAG: hypothetical protein WBG50_24595 [Desulfomonilaceae bacterium]
MRKRNLSQPFQIDKIRFADCFTAPSLRHFGVLIARWVLTVGVHTMSKESSPVGRFAFIRPVQSADFVDNGFGQSV